MTLQKKLREMLSEVNEKKRRLLELGIKNPEVQYHIRGKWADRKRLAGPGSPLGHSVAETEDGVLVAFDCDEVAGWLNVQLARIP